MKSNSPPIGCENRIFIILLVGQDTQCCTQCKHRRVYKGMNFRTWSDYEIDSVYRHEHTRNASSSLLCLIRA